MEDCIFCRIVSHDAPASFVYEDEWVCAFLDTQPINPGHLLVVPRVHAASFCALSPSIVERMMRVAQRLMQEILDGSIPCDGINLFMADGEAAGQEISHAHLHVIPRRLRDGFGLRFPAEYGLRPARGVLDETAESIRAAMQKSVPAEESRGAERDTMVHATVCFLVEEGNPARVLLAEKKRGFGIGKFNGPGGKLQPGETPEEAILREVHEEIGVSIHPSSLRRAGTLTFRFPDRPAYDHYVYVFVASSWDGVPGESEEMRPQWFSICNLPWKQMWQDDRIWLPIVLGGNSVVGEFAFGADNETVVSWRLDGTTPTSFRSRI